MTIVRKIMWFIISVLLILVAFCILLLFFQEKVIFFPQKLAQEHTFSFPVDFEEKTIPTSDGTDLHGILFKTDSAKGLIFYLHGNAGSLDSWGWIAEHYTDLGYDIFLLDYRGYGKSEGSISNERQFFSDLEATFESVISDYQSKEIIILGYSIGTGGAAWLASQHNPDLLILQAPYYSLIDMKNRILPIIPTKLLKYRFETYKYITQVKSPILIFHGDKDEVIPYNSSLKLREHFKPADVLVTLKNQQHNGMSDNPEYLLKLSAYLDSYQ